MALVTCADCGKDVSNSSPACIHCGRPLNTAALPIQTAGAKKSGSEGGQAFGWLLTIGGIAGVLYAFNMDTTVTTGGDYLGMGISVPSMTVNNLGLMEERRNYLLIAGLASLVGVILIVANRDSQT